MSNQAGMTVLAIKRPRWEAYLQFLEQPLAQVPATSACPVIPQGSRGCLEVFGSTSQPPPRSPMISCLSFLLCIMRMLGA